jgi:uncharacterized protein
VSPVFLNTVGLLALWDQTDQWHPIAAAAMQKIQAARATSITTTFVLLECGNAAARRPYRPAVDRLRIALESAGCLIRPSEDEWLAAWQAFVRGEGAAAGIVDQVSFQVMRRLGIQQVFTHDHHFAAASFEVLF